MTFRSAADHPASPLNHVGVAVKVIDEATAALHVGLVYRLTDGVPRMAHLAFHHDLRDEAAPTGHGYAWADCGWLQDPDYASSGAFVARFIQGTLRRRDVRYGLNPDLDCYATGRLVETDPRFGLTCATYIAAVLKGRASTSSTSAPGSLGQATRHGPATSSGCSTVTPLPAPRNCEGRSRPFGFARTRWPRRWLDRPFR